MIENRFRPPLEWIPALSASGAALGILVLPGLAPSAILQGASVLGLGALAIVRGRGAWRQMRYRANLRRLPVYKLTASEIPYHEKFLFLGRGFRWLPIHSQRLALVRERYQELLGETRLERAARELERISHGQHWLCRYTSRDAWWNPVRPLPPVHGSPELHGIEVDESDVYQDLGERVAHSLVLGTTRVGKTRLAEVLITQDIRRGDVVIVFDPKGDADLLRRMYAEAVRAGRQDVFYMFHLGFPEISARYNPIGSFAKVTEVATRVAGQLPSEGQAAAFKAFVWRFINVMARALVALGFKPNLEVIYANAVNIGELTKNYLEFWLESVRPSWRSEFEKKLLELGNDKETNKQLLTQANKTGRSFELLALVFWIQSQGLHDPIGDALISVINNDKTFFDKLIGSLYPLLEKVTTGRVSALLSPDYDDPNDPRPIFDWAKVIDQRAIVYIGLDSLTDHEVGSAVATSMLNDLTSTAGKLYKYGQAYGQRQAIKPAKLALHLDEVNELINDAFVPMVNKAGGAGFQVTAYTQTSADMEAKIGSAAKAQQIFGNFNTLIMLRVKHISTAEILTSQLPKVRIRSVTPDSKATDAGDLFDGKSFSSANADKVTDKEVEMLQPADLVQLPKGQAFALINGGQLYKLRFPLADETGDACMPADLRTIDIAMREQYQAYIDQIDSAEVDGAGAGWLDGSR
ncbi:type IV conjugative transfer system coupling protein TraD [Parachitinimonas caeni]|uniref:Type IV conjugative transfer system coupling protein TraD n=1 Tax=Parachitinimonas caeni TaxID=3031301 RepID=A0ABT7E1R3_9NEIS|nr:type IV conjugative transfer system coupling protein TraD [Parachitinimonas caeni]MDK2126255.1 type IV conjugative transfer system coupling protein TraD [Parachitinimonas caeni]